MIDTNWDWKRVFRELNPVDRAFMWPVKCVLDPDVARAAHAHRERAWRNGRGRSKAAAQRLARHLEVCPWC